MGGDTATSIYLRILVVYGCQVLVELPWWLNDKESACNARDLGSIPGLGRSSGGGHGNPLPYFCLENSMDIEFHWWATVRRIPLSQTRLSDLAAETGLSFSMWALHCSMHTLAVVCRLSCSVGCGTFFH